MNSIPLSPRAVTLECLSYDQLALLVAEIRPGVMRYQVEALLKMSPVLGQVGDFTLYSVGPRARVEVDYDGYGGPGSRFNRVLNPARLYYLLQ